MPQHRYFDGEAWTEEVRPFAAPTGAPAFDDSLHDAPTSGPSRRLLGILVAAVVLLAAGIAAVVTLNDRGAPQVAVGDGEAITPSPSVAPSPSPSIASPVDLRTVAWEEQSWTTDCVESGRPEAVSLTEGDDGQLLSDPGPDGGAAAFGMNYTVDSGAVRYGDVTGDGLDDAVFETECFLGNGFIFHVEVWSHDEEGEPTQLPPVLSYSKFDGTIDEVEIVDGKLRIATSEPAPGDTHPHLNGYPIKVVTDWAYVAGDWTAQYLTPAPPPAREQVTVPEVVGLPESEALAVIRAAGLIPGQREPRFDQSDPGTVLEVNPPEGSMVTSGTRVDFVISVGPERVRVRPVVGRSEADATFDLEEQGFEVVVQREFSDTVEEGIVIRQDPEAGTELEKGAQVTIVVSSGPAEPTEP